MAIKKSVDAPLTPLGYSQYTTTTPAFGFASTAQHGNATAMPAGAAIAFISVEGNSIRFTDDGLTTVTGSIGHLLPVGTLLTFTGAQELANLSFIQTGSGAILNVSYYKPVSS